MFMTFPRVHLGSSDALSERAELGRTLQLTLGHPDILHWFRTLFPGSIFGVGQTTTAVFCCCAMATVLESFKYSAVSIANSLGVAVVTTLTWITWVCS